MEEGRKEIWTTGLQFTNTGLPFIPTTLLNPTHSSSVVPFLLLEPIFPTPAHAFITLPWTGRKVQASLLVAVLLLPLDIL